MTGLDNSEKDIRSEQRLENFSKIFVLLEKTLAIQDPSQVDQMALIKTYELAFELSWKLMKDYLEEKGFVVKSPREAIKRAYDYGLINDGGLWLVALEKRNLSAHVYDEDLAETVAMEIRESYFPLIKQWHMAIKKEPGE